MDSGYYIAKPIYNMILCMVCEKDINLGLVRTKIDLLGESLEQGLSGLKDYLSSI